jgi:protein ImuB
VAGATEQVGGPIRMVTVWCPQWPTVAAGVPPDRPAAVLRANRVIARTPAAASAGVRTGDRRRAAQSACPELLVLDDDPDRDARSFEPVVRAIAEMAPRLEVVEPGWLCLVARGPSRYFGGDRSMSLQMAEAVRQTLGDVPVSVGVGVADGRSASAIAARRATATPERVLVVEPGGAPAFVAGLPISWLHELDEASPDLVDLFHRLGLHSLGDLAALDPGDVVSRFGRDGLHAHRIAGGVDDRRTAADDPPPEWWVEHPFPDPIEQLETVVFVAKRLADGLVERLAADGRVCVRLVVTIETEHGERTERAWYRSLGLSAAAMVERVRWQLEGWANQPIRPTGGIALVRLIPDEVHSDDGDQGRLWGGRSRADADAARAVVRLAGMAGEQSVRVPSWVGGRLPADRYRWVPAMLTDLDDPRERLDRGEGPWPGSVPSPPPVVVLDEPIAAEVRDRDGRPVSVNGRGEISAAPETIAVGGAPQRIVGWAGPWPVEQRWWSAERARRVARLQVVTEQGTAHLVGLESSRWSVIATYS